MTKPPNRVTTKLGDSCREDFPTDVTNRSPQVQGTPIDPQDLMIAAHAMSLGATLVTNNTRHFTRLAPALTIENWVSGGG